MRIRIWLLLLCSLVLAGCASPERRALVKYLHNSETSQNQLFDLQKELVAMGRLPVLKRADAVRHWLETLHARREQFARLEIPPASQKYNARLLGMFQALENYGNETLDKCDLAKLKVYSDQWAEELAGADKELSKLNV